MKTSILYILLFLTLFSSCSSNKKTSFELNHSEKGLTFDTYHALIWTDTLKENIVTLDSVVELQFLGLTGFNLVNEKAFVGASMSVVDSSGAVLFQNDDIFLDYDTIGFDPKMVKDWVGIYLVTDHPMKKGSSYTWNIRIWDKKGEGEVKADALLKMK